MNSSDIPPVPLFFVCHFFCLLSLVLVHVLLASLMLLLSFSLLEATVDVDRATRVAPLPTPERAMTLLDMIKKRCLGANWDDVTPRCVHVLMTTLSCRQLWSHLLTSKLCSPCGVSMSCLLWAARATCQRHLNRCHSVCGIPV